MFTPGGKIDLCGHATLGTAYVLFRFFETEEQMFILRHCLEIWLLQRKMIYWKWSFRHVN